MARPVPDEQVSAELAQAVRIGTVAWLTRLNARGTAFFTSGERVSAPSCRSRLGCSPRPLSAGFCSCTA